MLNLLSPVVWSRRIKHFCTPSQSKTKKSEIWGGWGHLSQGCGAGVCAPPPPSSILLMLPLQIPCSLVVAKLMSNSCAPSPDQIQRNLKESPVPRMLPHWGLCHWVGVNEKVQNTGILCPIFLRRGLYCFLAFIFFFKF